MKFNRIIILILDSAGCGVQPDYKKYHHENCNTLGNIYKNQNNFHLPNLERMGLNKILFDVQNNNSIAGKMMEKSKGNDTFAGVWEMFGIVFNRRFRSEKKGFSQKIIDKINSNLNINIVGNEYISGFKALDKFYVEHVKKVSPILYLADDGVVLLAAHENIFKPNRLNQMSERAADILKDQNISRVISRPFIGSPLNFIRTGNRKDFLTIKNLNNNSILNRLRQNKIKFLTTEHLNNILGGSPDMDYIKGNFNNNDLTKIIIKSLKEYNKKGVLLFCLQDFDMFGHKKDTDGYAKKLIEFDKKLPSIIKFLEKIDFYSGYSVEMAVLLQSVFNLKSSEIAQVYLGKRIHALQSVISLGKMSSNILHTLLRIANDKKRIKIDVNKLPDTLTNFISEDGINFISKKQKIEDKKLPPMISVKNI